MDGSDEPLTTLKIVIIGESDVGKSSLLLRFTGDEFHADQALTIGVDFKTKVIKQDDYNVKLAIWDTAGQERFRTLTPSYFRDAHGAILVYDVTKPSTFLKLNSWLNDLEIYGTKSNMIKMVVGNKCDQISDRVIRRDDGLRFAKKHQTLFLETSAKTSEGVKDAFNELVRRILVTNDLWQIRSNDLGIININDNTDKPVSFCKGLCSLT